MDKFEEYFNREQERIERLFLSGLISEHEYNRRCRYLEKDYIRSYMRLENE